MDNSFNTFAKRIKSLKEQEVKNKINRKKEYVRLLDLQCLEEEFLNIINRVLSLKEKFISLLNILCIGSLYDLGDYDFDFDLNRGWRLYISRFPEDNFFDITICNSCDASHTCLLRCVFYLDKKYKQNDRIYIDDFIVGEFISEQTPVIFKEIFTNGNFNNTYLRIFVLDLKNVDIEDCFFSSLVELEKEIAKRIY